MLVTSIVVIAFCILVSALFSVSETAMTGLSKPFLLQKQHKGSKLAKLTNKMLKDPNSLITSLLVGNNIANIFCATFIADLATKYYGETSNLFVISLATTAIVLIFAEILPKTLAFTNINNIALWMSPFVYISVRILQPVVIIFLKINHFFLKYIFRYKDVNNNVLASVDNLRGAIEMLHRQEESHGIMNQEKAMLHSVLDLNELMVADILNHRKNVVCVDSQDSKENILEKLINCPYTRVPVFKDKPENIIGVLNVKDVFKELIKNNNLDILSLLKKPYFIPESTEALDLLMVFRDKQERLALVVDEYGSFMGILTLGDILEEITGELQSREQDNQVHIETYLDSYVVPGDLTIRDLNRKMNLKLPDEDFTTVAGLILYETGKIPNVGNIFILHGFKFEILEKRRHQLVKIKITPQK